jgi:two-component system chemotaxis response regulator CheY
MAVWNPAKLSVMVIDDQPAARSMLKKMLKEMQINQVFEAGNGREALRLLDSAPEMIDMVICDWNMPGMSGIDLLRQVRSVGFDVPFLMVTGRADKESVIEAKDAGVSAYVSKPFSQTQLEAKMRVVMTKQQQQRVEN